MRISLLSVLSILLGLTACRKEGNKNFEGLVVPAHFPAPHYLSTANPISQEGFELGKRLFYDPLLSKTNTVSCANCHAQQHGFADHNARLSKGIYERLGRRNSPAIFNMAWNTSFMWDGGINHIEVMPLAPLTDTLEMGETMSNILLKLQADSQYPALFEAAFGDGDITDQQVFYALAQFMSMLLSANSKYDQYIKGERELESYELEGLQLFRSHCASCHSEPLFTDYSFRNNGLDTVFSADLGREHISQNLSDRGKFKVPTLRNVYQTYPYMHDGRFQTLEQVLDHYTSGIQHSPSLDTLLYNPIVLDETEKAKIIAFLRTLSDYELMSNPDFSD